jgi:hypothetical protein
VLQVDLGGWLTQRGPAGWLYRPALGLGLVDQLVERLLTSVILIKDEVEQQRFRVSGLGVRHHCIIVIWVIRGVCRLKGLYG